jgi:hypothetical protein
MNRLEPIMALNGTARPRTMPPSRKLFCEIMQRTLIENPTDRDINP